MSNNNNIIPSAPLLDEIDEDPFIKRQKELLKLFQDSQKKNNNINSNNNKMEVDPPQFNVSESEDYYEYLMKKKQIESEDEKLAKLLQESENSPPRQVNHKDDLLVALKLQEELEKREHKNNDDELFAKLLHEEELLKIKEDEEKRKKEKEDEEIARRVYEEEMIRVREDERRRKQKQDEEFAKKMQDQERLEQEKIRNLTQKDQDIARELYEEELRKKKEEEERENWEKTMNIIKNELRTDYDSEMARVLREKEDLERRLNETRYNNDIIYPDYWSPQYSENQVFYVANGTDEWYRVSNAFYRTMRNRAITRIDRIQNKPLWNFYYLKKRTMDNRYGSNERNLFHGSKTNAYDLIIRDGFDHRVSNLNGALGAGIYFALEANTSNTYVTGGGSKRMLYCRVLVGESGQGQNGLRRPPTKPGSNELYDSVNRGGTIFALFDNHQAYPEYIIYFQ